MIFAKINSIMHESAWLWHVRDDVFFILLLLLFLRAPHFLLMYLFFLYFDLIFFLLQYKCTFSFFSLEQSIALCNADHCYCLLNGYCRLCQWIILYIAYRMRTIYISLFQKKKWARFATVPTNRVKIVSFFSSFLCRHR